MRPNRRMDRRQDALGFAGRPGVHRGAQAVVARFLMRVEGAGAAGTLPLNTWAKGSLHSGPLFSGEM